MTAAAPSPLPLLSLPPPPLDLESLPPTTPPPPPPPEDILDPGAALGVALGTSPIDRSACATERNRAPPGE